MGLVMLAHDTELDRPVALKVPIFGGGKSARLVDRFRREAKIAATLAHRHLCPIYDVGQADGIDYLTMPFLTGEPLAAKLARDGPLPQDEAARLAATIARAVAAAHAAGVIHRDLKPSNVMIDAAGEPIVMDFGLARRLGPDDPKATASGIVLGTPTYAAPEQVGGGRADPDPRCDVYSLGVILYEMLVGRAPFLGPTDEVLRNVLTCPPAPPRRSRPELDRGLQAICLKALAKRPDDRHASMGEFAEALEGWSRGERSRPIARRAMIAAAIGSVAGVAGFLAWPRRPAKPLGPLEVGAYWTGRFRFKPPMQYDGDVSLAIANRDGETFAGTYTTEKGQYAWKVAGTIRGEAISWGFTEAIRDSPQHDLVGRCRVEGTTKGHAMTVVFTNPGNSAADMSLWFRPTGP